MKFYRDATGTFYRTQLSAKQAGVAVELMEVPTDHSGLCDFLNAIQPPLEYLRTAEEVLAATGQLMAKYDTTSKGDVTMEIVEPAEYHSYREGEPTVKFMGSRDPKAIFTCLFCGRNNHNVGTP